MSKIVKRAKENLHGLKENSIDKVNFSDIKERAVRAGDFLADKADDAKDKAAQVKEDIDEKLHELDNELKETINEYNDAYTLMNDKGVRLFMERSKAIDTIKLSENLINSIANHPKEFDVELETIRSEREQFTDSCEFAERELQAARQAANSAGAGAAAGASVAFMAPTAAMWIATTFGTASTGTAISTLSGAAATNAALAWLGGGSLAAEGGGMVAGRALLAMAGPVGWTIAGATLLTSILLFARKRFKLNKEKNEEIDAVKNNIEIVREMDDKINALLSQTVNVMTGLTSIYDDCLTLYGGDYSQFDSNDKEKLGTLVNTTKTLSAMLETNVE